MVENLGPQARVRDMVSELTNAAERLPRMLDSIEQGAQMMAGGRIKLHPDTIRALKGEPSHRPILPSLWLIILFLAAIAVAVKFF